MSDAPHEQDALPSYGQNGRDLILKVTSHAASAHYCQTMEPWSATPGDPSVEVALLWDERDVQ